MSSKRVYESHDDSDDEMLLALKIMQQMDDDAASVALCLHFTMELHGIAAESGTKSYRYECWPNSTAAKLLCPEGGSTCGHVLSMNE